MRRSASRRVHWRDAMLLLAGAAAGVLLLAKSREAAEGVRDGIGICLNQAVPSLFLFLVLAEWLRLSGAAGALAKPFGLLAKLLGIPRQGVPVFLLSLIGGYPVGPRMLGEMARKGEISPKTAGKLLCCTVNASPAFLIAGVAVPCFGSVKIGAVMFLCQALSALLTGMLARLFWGGSREEGAAREEERLPPGDAFVGAVTGGGKSMLTICAFVIVFTVLIRAAESLPGLAGWTGLLEVTAGCAGLPGGPFWETLVLATVYTSFGGLCVWMQAAAMLRGSGVGMGKFILMRGIHVFLSLFLTIFCAKRMALPEAVFSSFSEAAPAAGGSTGGAAVLLILICLMLLLCGGKCAKMERVKSDKGET